MTHFHTICTDYLDYCKQQKNLSADTLKAYRIDLAQFCSFLASVEEELCREAINHYVALLHQKFQPRTSKRKIASIKALCTWLVYEDRMEHNPFDKLRLKFNEPITLPRTIPLNVVEAVLSVAYQAIHDDLPQSSVRDVAVLELLFATGVRVSELCHLQPKQVDIQNGTILIFGKGAKERLLQIGNAEVLAALSRYFAVFHAAISKSGWLFVNRCGMRYSEQSVRAMIRKYLVRADIQLHVTPHMFRHTFATQLLEEDVDIRYIQSLLGHSSISTTQIYTHVTGKKQMAILATKHPRNTMHFNYG